jgi:hypothetical protein
MKKLCSLVFSALLFAGPAVADVAAPGPCQFAAIGSACTTPDNVQGTCQCVAAQNVQGACYSCPSGCMVCQAGTSTGSGGTTGGPDGGAPPPATDSSGCDISKGSTAKYLAPWLMASAFSLLVLFGRRRSR